MTPSFAVILPGPSPSPTLSSSLSSSILSIAPSQSTGSPSSTSASKILRSFLDSTFLFEIDHFLIVQKRENGGDGSNWKAILNNKHFEDNVLEICYSLTRQENISVDIRALYINAYTSILNKLNGGQQIFLE